MTVFKLDCQSVRELAKQASGLNLSSEDKSSAELLRVIAGLDGQSLLSCARHLHRGYAIICHLHTAVQFWTRTGVDLTIHQSRNYQEGTILIVSATVERWVQVLISNLKANGDQTFRDHLKRIFDMLNAEGFGPLFEGYHRRKDTTLYLEKK